MPLCQVQLRGSIVVQDTVAHRAAQARLALVDGVSGVIPQALFDPVEAPFAEHDLEALCMPWAPALGVSLRRAQGMKCGAGTLAVLRLPAHALAFLSTEARRHRRHRRHQAPHASTGPQKTDRRSRVAAGAGACTLTRSSRRINPPSP